jgi:16S rRNA (guanine966-N2)-methyltransferase
MNNVFLKQNNKIYVIAGKLKGRKIPLQYHSNLRPTTNRIRTMLFEWLSEYIPHSRCLDCFAGSGVLGIEAISRHAKFLTCLEINKKNIVNIKKNTKQLNLYNIEIIHTNTLYWLKKKGKPYDIIFVDPPFHQGLVQSTIKLLENNEWIKNNSLLYIEIENKTPILMSKNWVLYKKKITKKITCYLYIFNIHI